MSEQEFMRPRLTGARFDGHAIPLEVLGDLAVLEEMVIEVAKWKFLQANPGRKRSPRGFTDGVSLRLTGVAEGSAIPVISLLIASAGLFPPNNQIYLEQARDSIIHAIGAAEKNKSITQHLPEEVLNYFDKMGRNLRDGEAIEFTAAGEKTVSRLTKETRRKLLLASSTVKELTEETSVRGLIPEADQDDMSFEIQLFDSRKIRSPMASQHQETILEAFNGYKKGQRVLLQGVGKFNRQNRLQGFESIEHVSILDALDIPARLDELRSLKDGWLDGDGKSPSAEGLDWLSDAFEQRYPEDLVLPHLYPTAQGGVQAEWSLPPFEVSLEIDLVSHTGQWHSLDVQNGIEEGVELDLNNDSSWIQIAKEVKAKAGGEA